MSLRPADIERLRDALLDARLALQDAGSVEIAPNRADPADTKTDEDAQPLNEMNQVIASNRNRARAGSLEAIEAALDKIAEDEGEYGLCEECDERIPLGRLELMPWAELCTKCQTKLESPRGGGRKHLLDYG